MHKKKFIVFIIIVVAIAAVPIARGKWIVYSEDAFKVKVIDTETKKPIEGVVFVAVYHVREYNFPESHMETVDAKEALTDINGEAYIHPHRIIHVWPFTTKEVTEFIIYKPGYTCFDYYHTDYYKYFPNSPLTRAGGIDQQTELFKKGTVVELLKLNTREEKIKNIPDRPIAPSNQKTPFLFSAVNEGRRTAGLEEVGQ